MDSFDGEGVALAWGLLHAPTLSLNPGGPYMHCPMYCHSWACPGLFEFKGGKSAMCL